MTLFLPEEEGQLDWPDEPNRPYLLDFYMPNPQRQKQIDLTYLRICREYANLTRCLSRKVGALLVNPDGIVIGLGVNGPPRGIPPCSATGQCPRHQGEERASLEVCVAVHAEVNAILACARTNNSTRGCSLYVCPIGPCKGCAAQMIQAGISRLIFPECEPYDQLGPRLLEQSEIEVVTYPGEELDLHR